MIFVETPLKGAFLIELEKHEDERGFFARSFCTEEFAHYGLVTNIVQCNISYNNRKGTLRGMHYQVKPYEEVKYVRCIRGRVFDAIVDLRPDSETRGKPFGVELSDENQMALYIPAGFAHGYMSLTDDTMFFYQVSAPYSPGSAREVRWDDPSFNIPWPKMDHLIMSEKDRNAPLWSEIRD